MANTMGTVQPLLFLLVGKTTVAILPLGPHFDLCNNILAEMVQPLLVMSLLP
ncbi:hypothetical protein KPC190_04914 [Klebsiella pneumoniae]|nr:hypothetical protein [Klebsiella pneumoniae]MCB8850337.1 hypothetical protein [Klebsiella pneumoniae]MCB8867430.1 hypothetical protein [Klebsiella pneumoniae]